MTDVLTEEEKSILVRFASAAEDASILNVIETGVASEQDVIALARLYWKIVDDTSGQSDLDSILESLYTTLHSHCGNAGFADVWDGEIP